MTENSKSKSDERFKRVIKDPRFRRPARKNDKIRVDDRFKGIFSDPKFTRPYSVDKYGRKVDTKKAAKKEMEKFYRLESGDEEDEKSAAGQVDSEGIDTDASIEDDFVASSSESDSDDDVESTVLEEAFAKHPLVNTDIVLGDATRRLAIVNVDWDQLKAIDLYVLVNAFKTPMGQVKSVKIYPSEFGKERMQKEAIEGPPRDIFASKNISDCLSERENSDESESDSDAECDPLKDLKLAKTLVEESGNFDQAALRRYQLERLRYFYAVVECDSLETAAAIYHHCDGREFETSTNTLDLRYIPDDVEFNEDEISDSASSIPKKYTAKPAMVTEALQRSNVKLTWDQDDPDRRRLTRVNHGKVDYEEADLRAYLASDSETDEDKKGSTMLDSKEDRIARYRALLLSKDEGENVFGRKSHTDNDQLDITFVSALNEDDAFAAGAESDSEEEIENGETERVAVFDSEGNLVSNVETEEGEGEGDKDGKKKKKGSRDAFLSAKKGEKFILQKEWKKKDSSSAGATKPKKMHKKQSDLIPTDPTADSFNLDLQDDRFKAVYDSPAFAIDPTAPMFKKTKGMEAIIGERQKRRRDGDKEKDANRKKRSTN